MKRNDHEEIMVKLAKMGSDIQELVRRVGIQNGAVADAQRKISEIITKQSFEDGKQKGLSISKGTAIALIGIAVAILAAIFKP